MSGIGMVLNTAKHAISAQQLSINVTGHNIANVNTPGYSRQTSLHSSLDPVKLGNHFLGTGVTIESVTRTSDRLLEERLNDQKSSLSAYDEANGYMSILESLFNENSETSLSSQMSAFWNSWHDLSNTPNGASERVAVFDTAARLADQFEWLNENMRGMETELSQEIDAGISRVNTLAEQIATITLDIISASVTSVPNDQLDKRDRLIGELSELIDIRVFELDNGGVTVVTDTGSLLVYGADAYRLEQIQNRIIAVDPNGTGVDLTDRLAGGKLGGWLMMRDEVIPKYRNDLDAIAQEFIWSVNEVHSQGVGLDYFTNSIIGDFRTDASGMFASLDFGNRIDYTGDFKMWVKDTGTSPGTFSDITVDMDVSSVTVDNYSGAAPGSFQYRLSVTTAGTVGSAGTDPVLSWERFNPDGTSTGVTGTVTVTDVNTLSATVDGLSFDISAGSLYAGNTFRINTDATGAVENLDVSVVSGTGNSADDTYVFKIRTRGEVGTDTIDIEWNNSVMSGTMTLEPGALPMDIEVDGMILSFAGGTVFDGDEFTIVTDASGNPAMSLASDWHWTLASFSNAFNSAADASAGGGPGSGYVQASVNGDNRLVFTPQSGYQFAFSDDQVQDAGVAAALGFNTFFSGHDASTIKVNDILTEKDFIAAARIDGSTGEFGVGDNRNAIAIADIQYASRSVAQWNYDRGSDNKSDIITATIEEYYQGMIGSMGVKAESISRNSEFARVMVEKISEQRDSLTGVNLDEEMINLMKYQHAFAAASKLIAAVDEMLQTLLAVK